MLTNSSFLFVNYLPFLQCVWIFTKNGRLLELATIFGSTVFCNMGHLAVDG